MRLGLRLRAAARAVEAAAAAGLFFGLAGLLLDLSLELAPSTRTTGLAAFPLAMAAVLLWRLAFSAGERIGPLYLASRVEAHCPAFANRLIAAVELATGGDPDDCGPAALVFEQAEALASKIKPRRVVALEIEPTRVHRVLLAALGLTLAAAVVMGEGFQRHAMRCLFPWDEAPRRLAVRPRGVRVLEGEAFKVLAFVGGSAEAVTVELSIADRQPVMIGMSRPDDTAAWRAIVGPVAGSGTYRVRADYGEPGESLWSDQYAVTLVRTPGAGEVAVTYRYPAYTRRPTRTQAGGAVECIVGTLVTVELAVNSPLARARLVLDGDEAAREMAAARPAAQGREAWRADIAVMRSGSYFVEFTSADGATSRTPVFPIIARADAAPICEAFYDESPVDRVLSHGATFRLRASDDVALENLVLVVSRGRTPLSPGGMSPQRLARLAGDPDTWAVRVPGLGGGREFDAPVTIPPQVLPVEPGVTYTYYVCAADGRQPEAQLATSAARTFRLEEPKQRESLLAGGQQRKRRLPLLEPKDDGAGGGSGGGSGGGRGASGGSAGASAGRSLASLDDAPGSRPPPEKGPGHQAGREPGGERSDYASGPGLAQNDRPQAGRDEPDRGRPGNEGAPSDAGERGQEGSGESGREETGEGRSDGGSGSGGQAADGGGTDGGAGERRLPELPGQQMAGAGQGGAGASGTGGSGAGGSGASAGGGRPGSGPGSGGDSGPDRDTAEADGRGTQPGGARNAGLPEKREVDGGIPTGSETGVGLETPETVDEAAVSSLDVRPDDLARTGIPPLPGRTAAAPRAVADRPSTDAGTGAARAVGSFAGEDRIAIRKNELPAPDVVRARPVGRMYRALVGEYLRRLEELAEE